MARKQTNESHLSNMAMKAEMDHEVQMARSDLFKIAKYAVELHDMLKSVSEAEGLEGWQQSKITKAADYLGSVYHSMDYEVNVTESDTEDKTHDVNNDGKVNSDDYKAAKDKAIKKALKKPSINETMLRQIKKAILFQEGKIGRANMSPKAFELAEMHHKDLAALKANFERRATNEAKKKKPDADGDGVPDWADKKPGKDDNAKKKTESVEGVCEDCGNPSWKTLPEEKKKGSHGKVCWKGWRRGKGNSCHKVKGDG